MPVCSIFGSGISSAWKVGTLMEFMLIDFIFFSCNHLCALVWPAFPALGWAHSPGQCDRGSAKCCWQGRACLATVPGYTQELPAAACCPDMPLCRMRRYQCTDLLCFNSAQSSCDRMTATPIPIPEQPSQHHAVPSWCPPKNPSAGQLLLLWNWEDPSEQVIQLGLVNT